MCRGAGDCQGEAGRFIAEAMPDPDKQARLAAALRENLRRRKAQAREQAQDDAGAASADDAASPTPK